MTNKAIPIWFVLFWIPIALLSPVLKAEEEAPTVNAVHGEPANHPKKISLEEVWATLHSDDYRKEAADRMVNSAQETLSYTNSNYLPEFSIEGGYSLNDREMGTRLSLLPGMDLTVPVMQKNFYFLRSSVILPLYTGGRISDGKAAAQSGVKIALGEKERTILEIKFSGAETYLNVLRAKRFVELAEMNMKTLNAHERDVERLEKEGMVGRNELLKVQVAVSGARQKLIKAQNAKLLTTAAFHRMMHHDSMDEPVELEELNMDSTVVNLEESLARADAHRPELKILMEQSKALEYQAKLISDADLPQAAISGGYNTIQDKYLSSQDLWNVTLGFRWKVFDGGRSKHKEKALMEKSAALKSIAKETRTGIALQVRQAWLNLNETREQVTASRSVVDQAEENLRITRHRFAQGFSTNTDLLDAETLLDQSYTNYENARYDAILAFILLKKMEGTL